MPSVVIPPEVWSRIFFFVAPALPYVGMEKESFAEDAKVWRGDHSVKGQWRDTDQLMLVSKTINVSPYRSTLSSLFRYRLLLFRVCSQALVSPVFWSYLVLTSEARAQTLGSLLDRSPSPTQTRLQKLSSVKVVHVFGLHVASAVDSPCLGLLRNLPSVVHIHVNTAPKTSTSRLLLVSIALRSLGLYAPLHGLTGVVLGRVNFEAVTLALRDLAPGLRQLSISTIDSNPPPFARYVSQEPVRTTPFSNLVALSLGGPVGVAAPWLENVLDACWDLPVLGKVHLGQEKDPEFLTLGWLDGCRTLFLPNLNKVAEKFRDLTKIGLSELAFWLDFDWDVFNGFTLEELQDLLDLAEGGRVDTVKAVVVVEKAGVRSSEIGHDCCLAQFVNKRRLPSLEKVVWVAAKKDDDDSESWSGHLVKWIIALKDSGVKFEIQ